MKHSISLAGNLAAIALLATLCLSTKEALAGGMVAAWGNNSSGEISVPNGLDNVKAISVGFNHSLALKGDGTIVTWGYPYNDAASVPTNLPAATAVAAGANDSMILRSDGTVTVWGNNYYGQTNVPSERSNVVAIAAGGSHIMALKSDGSVEAWGNDTDGQTNVPAGLSNVIAIAAGEYHSLALRADGTVVAWGAGSNLSVTSWKSYGQSIVPPGLSNVVAIAAGGLHSLALKGDGTVVAWGYSGWGQTNVPPDLSNVVAIAAGSDHSVALKADGTVVCWGQNSYGQANVPAGLSDAAAIAAGGNSTFALVFSGPVRIMQNPQDQTLAYPYTSNVTFSVTATGAGPLSYHWLFNGIALADNSRITGSTNFILTVSNVQPSDIGSYSVIVSNAFGPVVSSSAKLDVVGAPVVSQAPSNRTAPIGSDVSFTLSALGTAPLSYQWFHGDQVITGATNISLMLQNVQFDQAGSYFARVKNGFGTATSAVASLTVTDSAPYIVSQPRSWTTYIGYSVIFSLDVRGSEPMAYQWRFNGEDIPDATNATLTLTNLTLGQTGYYYVVIDNAFGQAVSSKALLTVEKANVVVWGNHAPGNLPPGMTNLAGIAAGYDHIVGLKPDGTVQVWGTQSYTPQNVTNIVAVAAWIGNLALKSDGTVFGWFGPLPPAGVSNVLAIDAEYSLALALKSDNTVVAWGDSNPYGETNVPPGLSNVVGIAAGPFHALAVKADGTVVAWGSNQSHQTNVPPGLTNVIAVAGGMYHSLALNADGTVAAWGGFYPVTNFPPGLSNIVAIAGGGLNQSLALKADGSLIAWGGDRSFSLPPGISKCFCDQFRRRSRPAELLRRTDWRRFSSHYPSANEPNGAARPNSPASRPLRGHPTDELSMAVEWSKSLRRNE